MTAVNYCTIAITVNSVHLSINNKGTSLINNHMTCTVNADIADIRISSGTKQIKAVKTKRNNFISNLPKISSKPQISKKDNLMSGSEKNVSCVVSTKNMPSAKRASKKNGEEKIMKTSCIFQSDYITQETYQAT